MSNNTINLYKSEYQAEEVWHNICYGEDALFEALLPEDNGELVGEPTNSKEFEQMLMECKGATSFFVTVECYDERGEFEAEPLIYAFNTDDLSFMVRDILWDKIEQECAKGNRI